MEPPTAADGGADDVACAVMKSQPIVAHVGAHSQVEPNAVVENTGLV